MSKMRSSGAEPRAVAPKFFQGRTGAGDRREISNAMARISSWISPLVARMTGRKLIGISRRSLRPCGPENFGATARGSAPELLILLMQQCFPVPAADRYSATEHLETIRETVL